MQTDSVKYNYDDEYRFNFRDTKQFWEVKRKGTKKFIECPQTEIFSIPPEVKDVEMNFYNEYIEYEKEKSKIVNLDEKRKKKKDDKKEFKENVWDKYFEEGKFFKSNWLGDDICDNHLKLFYDTHHIYNYEDGLYKNDGERTIRMLIQRLLGDKSLKRHADETIYYIQNKVYVVDQTLINPSKYLNLKNGVLELKSEVLIPHSPDMFFTYQLAVSYNPEINDPAIINFLDKVLPADTHNTFFEMLGYMLTSELHLEKAFMFTGTGGNGKSVAIDLICSLFGTDSYSAIPLQDLDHRFRSAGIEGKLLNVYRDLPQKPIEDTGNFKSIVSSEEILIEKKNKDPKKTKPICKLLFSANHMVISPDMSDAYFRRWILFEFKNKFTDENKDINILKRIVTPSALSTLLNYGIEGFKRLHKNKKFSLGVSNNEILDRYRKHSDSVIHFVDEQCFLEDESYTSTKELFESYKSFCIEWDMSPLGKKNFNQRLKDRFGLECKDKSINRNGVQCWMGIRTKNGFSYK